MKHDVKFSIPERELGNADIQFNAKRDAQKFETLKISKGSLVWVPKDNTYGYKMGWSTFHEIIHEKGKSEK